MKGSLRELKEQLESPEEADISHMQIAKQAMNERGQKLFKISRQEVNEVYIASLARWEEVLTGFPVETVKVCALIGLHMMIWENSGLSENGSFESSGGSCEGNVGNDALHIILLHGSGDTIALFPDDCEVAKVALSCQKSQGHDVSGIA